MKNKDLNSKFCNLCNKWFKSETFYNNHINNFHNSSNNILISSNVMKSRKDKRALIPEISIRSAIEEGGSLRRAAMILQVSYPTILKYTRLYYTNDEYKKLISDIQINTKKHRVGSRYKIRKKITAKWPLEYVFNGSRKNITDLYLLFRLIDDNYKLAKCEECDFDKIRLTDYQMPLLLNYIDGNKDNKKLDNLRILCYNCYFILNNIIDNNLEFRLKNSKNYYKDINNNTPIDDSIEISNDELFDENILNINNN